MAEEILILMSIPDIVGNTMLRGSDPETTYADWIPVESCSFGFERKVSSIEKESEAAVEEEPAIKPTFEPITISRGIDDVTPALMAWLVKRDIKEKVIIDHLNRQGAYFLRYELMEAQLVSLTVGFQVPETFKETLKMTYNSITVEQRTFDEVGNLTSRKNSASYEVVEDRA